jgi:hypothetical protein
VAVLLGMTAMSRAQDELSPYGGPIDNGPPEFAYPDAWSEEMATPPEAWASDREAAPTYAEGPHAYAALGDSLDESGWQLPWFCPRPRWFGLRHSSTHGRNVGRGQPFTGTSWLNRPYYVGGQIGPMWFTQSIDDNVSTDIDTFGGVFAGWDTDHYWGNEFHLDWSTPELRNGQAPNADRTDSSFTWSYSCLYYPWGDAKVRPYWRLGVGNSHFDWPRDDGSRHDEWMLTFPLGAGIKYPIRRWLAARADVTDYISLNEGFPTQHNVAITIGLEWRFGTHPPSYWPWNPSRHIW